MGIKQVIANRIKNICIEKDITMNTLSTLAGVTPSTIYSMLDPKRKDIGIVLLKKVCDGLDLTITDFFDDEVFKELEQEIK